MERLRSLTAVTVALCALLAAAGGMALASGDLSATASKKHPDKGADTKLFNKLLKKAAPKLTVRAAGTAAHATDSDTVGGMKLVKVFYASAASATPTTLLTSNGLQISATCVATNKPGGGPAVVARYTGSSQAAMSTEGVTDFNTGIAKSGGFMAEDSAMVNGGKFEVTDFDDDTTEDGGKVGARFPSAGTFTFTDSGGGAATTLVWHSAGDAFADAAKRTCLFHGVATVG